MKAVLVGFVISLAVAACAAFDGDTPDRTCRTDNDCFRAQGELCNVDTRRCYCSNPAFGCVQEDAGVAPQAPVDDPALPAEVSP
jgi:hypothetical protein